MRFVIVGAGRVGRRTARVLTQEGHDVTVVELDSGRAERAHDEEFDIVEGDGSSESDLVSIGIEEADAIGALSGDVTVNLVACMIGKAYDCRTVLRVDNDYREYILNKYASDVDEVIYPERLGAIAAKNALMGGTVEAIADVAQNIQLVELTVTEESPMRGYTLSELELPADSKLLGFGKQGQSVGIPNSDDSLELGDKVVVIADFEVLGDVRQIIVGQGAVAATA